MMGAPFSSLDAVLVAAATVVLIVLVHLQSGPPCSCGKRHRWW